MNVSVCANFWNRNGRTFENCVFNFFLTCFLKGGSISIINLDLSEFP